MSLSNISSDKYGYSYVVATTQASINATMKQWLSTIKNPVINVCYVANKDGQPTLINYDELKRQAKGTDPFLIPDATPTTSANVQNLYGARFMTGFRVKLGIPRVPDPTKIPDIVTLDVGGSKVMFNMFCAEFTIVELQNGWTQKWFASTQTATSPWIFQSEVNLSLSTVEKNDYVQMPPDVQAQIKNKGAMAFSVQQLWFDLTTASLYKSIEIPGLDKSGWLYNILQRTFVSTYMTAAKSAGQPLFGVTIVDHSPGTETLRLTDLTMSTSQYMDATGHVLANPTPQQKSASTLNYLCAADQAALPPAVPFTWNWVDVSQMLNQHGVLSTNRNTFAKWIYNQIINQARSMCYEPGVNVTTDGWTTWYKWWATNNKSPTVEYPKTGATVLKLSYASPVAEDKAGPTEEVGGRMKLSSTYTMTVDFTGKQVIIKQHLVFWTYLRYLSTDNSGNVVDRTTTDTYDLGAESGNLTWKTTSSSQNNDLDPSVSSFLNFFTGLNDLMNDVKTWARNFANTKLVQPPISDVNKFVFPGGKTFAFKDVGFSQFQDLIVAITYLNTAGQTGATLSSLEVDPVHTVHTAVIPQGTTKSMGSK